MRSLEELDGCVTEQLPELTAIRRDLHAHPQLAYQETYASARVCDELDRLGVPYVAGLAETGVVAWLLPEDAAARQRPGVGLRADMDALPITEQTDLPYASRHQGMMHACGHDGHTTVLLGAVRVLANQRARLTRPVKFVFQPAEEGGAGARRLVEQGVLGEAVGGFAVERMYALHGSPKFDLGDLHTRTGAMMAATTAFDITITGPGGHAAGPHNTVDTIVTAAQLVIALQTVVSRNIAASDAAVVTVGALHAGDARNVIPGEATIRGTIRTLDDAVQKRIVERVEQLASGVAGAMGCGVETVIRPGYPVTHNAAAATAEVMAVGRECLGEQHVAVMPDAVMGGEDFSFYGQQVEACFFYIGLRPPGQESYPGLHTPLFDFNDDAIGVGVRLMSRLALR